MAGFHRLSDFKRAVSKGKHQIDRTPYLEKYEKSDQRFVICLRPSGFDKTLLLSMLRYYYAKDLIKISRKLFDKFYISTRKTPLCASFKIFYLNFSTINIHDPQTIASIYRYEIIQAIEEYLRLQELPPITTKNNNPVLILRDFLEQYGNIELFVLINEYDHFHHEILDHKPNGCTTEKSDKNPLIRSIYAELNQAIYSGQIGRIFVAGIDSSQDR